MCLGCKHTCTVLKVVSFRYDVVSPGEMQKIAFARIFFHKPPFVCTLIPVPYTHTDLYANLGKHHTIWYLCCSVLDEATCALSEETEHQFYTSLKLMGVTVMSVGHRSSIRKVGRHFNLLSVQVVSYYSVWPSGQGYTEPDSVQLLIFY